MTAMRQLGLPFAHEPQFEGASFLRSPSNQAALAWLEPGADWPQGRLALWGEEGSGKTHLLHLWAGRQGARLLPGPGLRFQTLMGELGCDLAVDDADAAAERDLLHLLNAAHEAGLRVLLAARTAPARWNVALPDLASRLRAMAAVELRPPEDGLLRALLARLLADRQLAVPEALQDWLRLRLPRTPAALREAAARLDRLALAAGSPVNRAVAARVLADMGHDEIMPGNALATDEDLTQGPDTASPPSPRLL